MIEDAPDPGPAAPPDELPATVRDRYVPVSVVGVGASSRVYRALDRVTGGDVALQIVRSDPGLAPIRDSFVDSIQAAMEIRHPALVTCLDTGHTAQGDPFAVMELLTGETLGAHLTRVGHVPWPVAVRWFLDAAAGLAALHDAGLIHRDVKPDNLFLVGPVGSAAGLKVIDFGHAKRHVEDLEPMQQWVVGTTEYMPPEQVLCDPVDARSDVYSLGAVLFRALTGELPFAEVPRNSVLAHHLVTPAPPPSWLVDDLPPSLGGVVLTALRKHPDNRFPTMDDLRQALLRVSADEGGVYQPPPLPRSPDRYEPQREHASAALRALGEVLAA